MVTKQIYKVRKIGDQELVQSYDYAIQEKYLKYKRNDPVHKFLRERMLRETPEAFRETGEFVTSASSSKEYHAVNPDGSLFYKIKKELQSRPMPVKRYSHGSHDFSKWILDSQGYVDKKAAIKAGLQRIMPDGHDAHKDIQDYLMNMGLAEAVEVPAWVSAGERDLIGITPKGERVYNERIYTTTCFIDALFFYKGYWWIYDYKPNAAKAANKHTVSQLLTNLDLLSYRTGFKNFKCAYGDEKDTFELLLPGFKT